MSIINITLTDDHPLVLQGVMSMLKTQADLNIIDVFKDGKSLLEGLKSKVPDILLLDAMLPDLSAKELVITIKALYPFLKIIILTSYDAPILVTSLMRVGCAGFLLKDTSAQILIECIQQVYAGAEYIEPSIKKRILDNVLQFKKDTPLKEIPVLTRREKEILTLIAAELTT